jgi:hypothetical protein
MPASTTETAEAVVAAPLVAPPRARGGEAKTVPGVRLEDLERDAAAPPSVDMPSMLDEELQEPGGLTPPPTLAGQPPLPEEPPPSIEVSPELFSDAVDDAAFRPGVKRYPEPDTGRLELPVLGSGGTPPTGLMAEPAHHQTVVMEMPRPPGSSTGPMGGFTPRSGSATGPAEAYGHETPRGGVVTGPGVPVTGEQPRAWTGPVTAPSEVVDGRGGGRALWMAVAVAVLAAGGGAAYWLVSRPAAPKPASRISARAEEPAPARPAAPSPAPQVPAAASPEQPLPPPVPAGPAPAAVAAPEPPPPPTAPVPGPVPAAARPPAPRPVAPAARPGRSERQAVEQEWARLTERMEGLEMACGGNEPKMDKLRSRYSAIRKTVQLEERDDADLLKRISNLMDAINECGLQ